MKYKTLFRLAMKFMGLVFFFWALPTLTLNISMLIQERFEPLPGGTSAYFMVRYWVGTGVNTLQMLLGLYLFFRGEWIVNLAIPSNRPYCPECGYEVSKVKSHICPECGTAFRAPASVQPTPDDGAAASGAASP